MNLLAILTNLNIILNQIQILSGYFHLKKNWHQFLVATPCMETILVNVLWNIKLTLVYTLSCIVLYIQLYLDIQISIRIYWIWLTPSTLYHIFKRSSYEHLYSSKDKYIIEHGSDYLYLFYNPTDTSSVVDSDSKNSFLTCL